MRREGLRAIAFAALCVCFATAFFISSQPPSKSASRWFVAEKLNLKQLQDVTTPVTLFHSIMDVSSTLRSLSPLSSDYLGDPLGKASCPAVPDAAHNTHLPIESTSLTGHILRSRRS